MTVQIRQATVADTEEVLSMVYELALYHGFTSDRESHREWVRKKISGENGESVFYLAVIDTEIAGTAAAIFSENVPYLSSVYVKPEFRRRGVAEELMKSCEIWFSAKGTPEIQLQVKGGNEDAIRLYRKKGYTEHFRAVAGPIQNKISPTFNMAARCATRDDWAIYSRLQGSGGNTMLFRKMKADPLTKEVFEKSVEAGSSADVRFVMIEKGGNVIGAARLKNQKMNDGTICEYISELFVDNTVPEVQVILQGGNAKIFAEVASVQTLNGGSCKEWVAWFPAGNAAYFENDKPDTRSHAMKKPLPH